MGQDASAIGTRTRLSSMATSSSYLATPMFSVVISIDFFLFVACFPTRLLLKPKESNESFVEEQFPGQRFGASRQPFRIKKS